MSFNTDLASEAVDTLKSKNKSFKQYSNIKLIETSVDKNLSKQINKRTDTPCTNRRKGCFFNVPIDYMKNYASLSGKATTVDDCLPPFTTSDG